MGNSPGSGQPPKPAARLVRRIVCAYRQETLPGDWLQTWRRLDRLLLREGFAIKATLAPLEDLPEDTDIVVVPPELRDLAREKIPSGVLLLVTQPSAAAGAFADLVQRLTHGTEITAQRLDPVTEQGAPKIVTYRGQTLLD